ncbi:MAG: tRNA epoxyqueuosine(34) reductase QueG [Hyphomonadaceae bacterium]
MAAMIASAALKQKALALGFDACGIARADAPWPAQARLQEFIAQGRHGAMAWMAETAPRRGHPQAMWPQARAAILLGVNYAADEDPLAALAQKDRAAFALYARRRDYHDVIKGRLKDLAGWFARESGAQVKVFVDTAPLMEKPLAQAAGLGWQGKHTNLVSRAFGSWLFLGAILTDADLAADEAEQDHCGQCRACLDICPTDAFPAPYQLDARRCVAYLTIEHDGPIPAGLREGIGNRVFGCDDCLAVCPWNKFAAAARETRLALNPALAGLSLTDLAGLDETGFRALFAGTPMKRTGHARILRNVLIAIGNSSDPMLAPAAEAHLAHDDPAVRGAAVWALRRLLDPARFAALKHTHAAAEADGGVKGEWES